MAARHIRDIVGVNVEECCINEFHSGCVIKIGNKKAQPSCNDWA
jgi:hypothetical protein